MKKTGKSRISKPQDKPVSVSGHAVILEGYLKGWAPAMETGPGVILKTTREIIDDLEDMADLDSFTVADIMAQLGFRTEYAMYGGSHGWMMRQDPAVVHHIDVPKIEDLDND